MPRRVLGIVHVHENAVLYHATEAYCRALNLEGFAGEVVDLSKPNSAAYLAQLLGGGEISFCFGLQGVGSQLEAGGVNLWTKTRIPFLGIHFDNPCYNPLNHHNLSAYVANLYQCESFLDIQRRYIGGDQVSGVLPFEIPEAPLRAEFPFVERLHKLLFLKTGGTVDEFVAYFDSLPRPIRDGVWQILERAERDPNLLLCDLVQDLFAAQGYDHRTHPKEFWAVVQSMDFYLRRRRAIDFVEWLKFQDGALIIGDGWDMIDRSDARAQFLPAVDAMHGHWAYERSQFICNTNPYGRDLIHERIVWGLLFDCCVLTDTNAWWDKNFSNVPALTRFSWDRPLDEQLNDVVNNMEAAGQRAQTGRLPAERYFLQSRSAKRLIAYADQVRERARQIM